jgi:AcrR family transcriptional regulator
MSASSYPVTPALDWGLESQPAKQMSPKVLAVLEATIRMLGGRTMADFSIESVARASGVSRATIYRYFSTKEDLLQGVSEFICRAYETGIIAAAEAADAPIERFTNVLNFMERFTEERGLLRMFEADASFHLAFFRTHYARHRIALMKALETTFDFLERRDDIVIDREVTAGRLVRLQLSRLIVPLEETLTHAWESAGERVEDWIVARPRKQ